MDRKRRLSIIAACIVLGVLLTLGALNLLPLNMLSIQQKPEQPPQKLYDYYQIIDADTDRTLMYVPLVVGVGDEVITEENKRYQVVKVEQNRAYARYVEEVNIEKYKPK
jgi:hypothetical protein